MTAPTTYARSGHASDQCLAHRGARHDETRNSARADAARADRDDDDRDLILIGRLGDQAVAAAALGHAVLFTAFMRGSWPCRSGRAACLAGVRRAQAAHGAPRAARRHVGGRHDRRAAHRLGLLHTEKVLMLLGQTPELSALAGRYLDGMAWSMTPAWLFIALAQLHEFAQPAAARAVDHARGDPGQRLTRLFSDLRRCRHARSSGCSARASRTTIVNIGMLLAAIWVCYTRRPFRKFHVLGHFWRTDWPLLGKLTLMGLPISAAMLLEHGLFAGATLMMGMIGTSALAAHQIALQIAAIVFMVPLGVSLAATVRVGHAVGRAMRPRHAARRPRRDLLGALLSGCMAVCRDRDARSELPFLFLGDARDTGDGRDCIDIACSSVRCSSSPTACNAVAAGALRGFNDTFIPFLFSASDFGWSALVSAYVLAFPLGYGAAGIWIGLLTGLTVYAATADLAVRTPDAARLFAGRG